MKAYKVFRIQDGQLTSLFLENTWRITYHVGEETIDPKPDRMCLGMMVFKDKDTALQFRSLSYVPGAVVREVEVDEQGLRPGELITTWNEFKGHHVDKLTVGKLVPF